MSDLFDTRKAVASAWFQTLRDQIVAAFEVLEARPVDGPLGTLAAHYAAAEARGEICVVVGPAPAEAPTGAAELDALLADAEASGLSLRDASE